MAAYVSGINKILTDYVASKGGLDIVHVSFVVFLNHALISHFMCQLLGRTLSVIQVTESDYLLVSQYMHCRSI